MSRPDPPPQNLPHPATCECPLLPRIWGMWWLKGHDGTPGTSLATVYAPPGAAGPWALVSVSRT